jgi:hypothetical protein
MLPLLAGEKVRDQGPLLFGDGLDGAEELADHGGGNREPHIAARRRPRREGETWSRLQHHLLNGRAREAAETHGLFDEHRRRGGVVGPAA